MFGRRFQLNEETLPIVEEIGRHMPGGFLIYKASGERELLYANQAVLEIYGCRDLEEFRQLTGFVFRGLINPEDYEARAGLLWTASWAMNGLLDMGKGDGWSCHQIEHFLSAYYDVTHGVGLAILTPSWMEHILSEDTVDRFAEYGENVWGICCEDPMEAARLAIERTRTCFESFGLPTTLHELGIGDEHFEDIAEKAVARGLHRAYVPLGKEDVLAILRRSL